MLIVTVLNFLFALSQTTGNVRAYSVLAQIISFSLLYLTVGRLIKRFSNIIHSLILTAYHFIYDPCIGIYSKFTAAFTNKCTNFFKLLKNIKK